MTTAKDKAPIEEPVDNSVPLKHPVTTAEGEISRVEIRPIKVSEMKAAQGRVSNDSVDIELSMVSEASGLSMDDLDDMHMIDYENVVAKFTEINVGKPEEEAKASPNKHKLKHKFTTGAGAPVEQLHVRGIKVREMKQAQRRGDGDPIETECAMMAVACDLVLEDLDDMYMIDYQAISARFSANNSNRA